MFIPPSRSSDLAERFGGLAVLASDYVNNEWDFEFGTPENAVAAFAEEHPELCGSAVAGITTLLNSSLIEQDRRDALGALGWGYAPKADSLDLFLRWIVLRLPRTGEAATKPQYDTVPVAAATFPDLPIAEATMTSIVRAHLSEIERFLATTRKRCRPLRLDLGHSVGTVLSRDGEERLESHAVLLVHNDEGYPLVYSGYPEVPRPAPRPAPALEVLFGAYFHADWFDDDEQPLDVVLRFARTEPADLVYQVAEDLGRLRDEDEAGACLQVHALGSYFLPRPTGQLVEFIAEAIALLTPEETATGAATG